jgi:flagellar hook-basal body complex protein FliE
MSIGPVGSSPPLVPLQPAKPQPQPSAQGSFSERVESAFDQVKAAQAKASQSARGWEMGTENDLAAVMVDQQVASLGFQLTLNIRNKALGAYRDIMNMPL